MRGYFFPAKRMFCFLQGGELTPLPVIYFHHFLNSQLYIHKSWNKASFISNTWYHKSNSWKVSQLGCIQVGFSFAKLLRNFCGTERIVLLPLRNLFARKKTFYAIKRKSHFVQNFVITHLRNSVLRNSAISQCSLFISLMILVLGNENQPGILHVFWGSSWCTSFHL